MRRMIVLHPAAGTRIVFGRLGGAGHSSGRRPGAGGGIASGGGRAQEAWGRRGACLLWLLVVLFLRGAVPVARFFLPASLAQWGRASVRCQCGGRELLVRIGEIGGILRGPAARN